MEGLITNNGLGFISEEKILLFTNKDCNDYLVNSHTDVELAIMSIKDKTELILDLEYNFQYNCY